MYEFRTYIPSQISTLTQTTKVTLYDEF